jgi:hypothetical protein
MHGKKGLSASSFAATESRTGNGYSIVNLCSGLRRLHDSDKSNETPMDCQLQTLITALTYFNAIQNGTALHPTQLSKCGRLFSVDGQGSVRGTS